jgi:hypothetical protein
MLSAPLRAPARATLALALLVAQACLLLRKRGSCGCRRAAPAPPSACLRALALAPPALLSAILAAARSRGCGDRGRGAHHAARIRRRRRRRRGCAAEISLLQQGPGPFNLCGAAQPDTRADWQQQEPTPIMVRLPLPTPPRQPPE